MLNQLPGRRSRLYLGDCLDHLARLRACSTNLVLCDLPYGVTDCKWDRKIDLDALWNEYKRVLAPRGAIALFAQGRFAAELLASAPRGWFRYELVWDKQGASGWLNANRLPMRGHELLLIFGKGLRYEPQGLRACTRHYRPSASTGYRGHRGVGEQKVTGYATSVLRFAREKDAKPCQKPVALLDWIIRSYCRPGETVLDNAMGLGSTGGAAALAGRRFVGVEIDPERFSIARKRIRHAMRARRVITTA